MHRVQVVTVDDELRWERFCAIADDSLGNRFIGAQNREPTLDVYIRKYQYKEPELPSPALVQDMVVCAPSLICCACHQECGRTDC